MTYSVAGLKTGDKIGKATVVIDIIKKGNPEIRPCTAMKPLYVTIHNTGNRGKGANAKAHNNLIHNLAGKSVRDTSHVSWHAAVDEDYIYIHIPFNETAWHCGDGAKGNGNSKSIGLEICMHSDQKHYEQAEENAIALTVHLICFYKLSANEVRPHQDWSGKYCPELIMRRDGNFAKYRARTEVAYQIAISGDKNTVVKGDENIMQFSSSTTKSAVRDELVQFVGKGLINQSWLVKFDKGEMTNGDYDGLKLIVNQRLIVAK
ncbi:N-acetylmuramoyl-L-alanine amidase [Solibacillus sp. MA9]|uniref:N-acetylmuramoyl-L-alanine amidase n=1 Tax=Solibacillus palustris TaxID=2908203 RepID=A0ABS9UBT4_9BACL|nr:N-acetylmuramoyl-L-alanine amidase [Solibacillus sp. MA9]MCH7321802.1 N-acetylmuramoyl-L-alanine amidase [Solibacillus sp. MA9]